MSKAVVVLSGGQDSATCLYWARERFEEVHTITFDYGQRHAVEVQAAERIAEMAGVASMEFVSMPGILQGTSPLVSDEELEQYDDHESLPGGIEKTFVPLRNQLFLTIAANRAFVLGAPNIVTGVSGEDYGGYPDCREPFIRAFQKACNVGTFDDASPNGPLDVLTPLMYLSKASTVRLALILPGCYEALAFTHTSYDGAYPPTGHDHATLLRQKGFEEGGVPDPLVLRAVIEERMGLPMTPNYNRSNMLVAECWSVVSMLLARGGKPVGWSANSRQVT